MGAGPFGAAIVSTGGAIILEPLLVEVWGPAIWPLETFRASGDLGLCMAL